MSRELAALGVAGDRIVGARPMPAQEWATLVLNDGQRMRGGLVAMSDYDFDIRAIARIGNGAPFLVGAKHASCFVAADANQSA